MSGVMTGLVQYALQPQAVELRELAVPEVGEDDVLLRVGAVSVCGSDVHQYHNKQSWPVRVPVVLGHEFGGTVARAGARVRGFKEGDRVVSETAASICGACLYCRTGEYNLCPQRSGFGYGTHGGMAEFVRVPARCLHAIPDVLPFERAALTEPCCVGYNAVAVKSRVRPGDIVVVLGPGPIGLPCRGSAGLPAPGVDAARTCPTAGLCAPDAHGAAGAPSACHHTAGVGTAQARPSCRFWHGVLGGSRRGGCGRGQLLWGGLHPSRALRQLEAPDGVGQARLHVPRELPAARSAACAQGRDVAEFEAARDVDRR